MEGVEVDGKGSGGKRNRKKEEMEGAEVDGKGSGGKRNRKKNKYAPSSPQLSPKLTVFIPPTLG